MKRSSKAISIVKPRPLHPTPGRNSFIIPKKSIGILDLLAINFMLLQPSKGAYKMLVFPLNIGTLALFIALCDLKKNCLD